MSTASPAFHLMPVPDEPMPLLTGDERLDLRVPAAFAVDTNGAVSIAAGSGSLVLNAAEVGRLHTFLIASKPIWGSVKR